ncbi:MAG: TonB family protein [Candidatus Acidiferrales bacterium]
MLTRDALSRRARHSIWPLGLPAAFLSALFCVMPAAARTHHRTAGPPPDVRQVSTEKSGRVATHPGLRLRLATDVGDVQIFTDSTDEIRYTVRISTDASQPGGEDLIQHYTITTHTTDFGVQLTGSAPANTPEDALWVNYEIHVPRHYSLDVATRAGNIQTQDIDGRISLTTGGGNITAGRVGPMWQARDSSMRIGDNYSARLETQGGHITVGNVSGDLHASTAGGHISTGDVRGQVVLHTGGGHIHTGSVAGGQLGTDGGNIVVERSSAGLVVTTAGGQISVGEVTGGPVHARTGGGAVRIARVTGPTEVQSTRGNIALTCLEGPLHASTSDGTITAWFLDEPAEHAGPSDQSGPAATRRAHHDVAPSELESGQGDIVVYLPRELPLTIEATVEQSPLHQIVADPSLPMKVNYQPGPDGAVREQCDLNGGGDVLRLKADSGNIVLKYGDPAAALRYSEQQMEQLRDQMELQMESQVQTLLNADTLKQIARQADKTDLHQEIQSQVQATVRQAQQQAQQAQRQAQAAMQEEGRFERLTMRLEEMWWGDVHVDADAQQKKLITQVTPAYPDVAREAGVEGTVTLRVEIGQDGTVQDIEPISGPPLLARAAEEAVAQWRYAPTLVDGNPVNVVTTVSVEFHLK